MNICSHRSPQQTITTGPSFVFSILQDVSTSEDQQYGGVVLLSADALVVYPPSQQLYYFADASLDGRDLPFTPSRTVRIYYFLSRGSRRWRPPRDRRTSAS